MPHHTVIEGGVEPADFTGLPEVVLKDIEELFCDSIFPFWGQRKTAIPELSECSQQDTSKKENNRQAQTRMWEVILVRSNAEREESISSLRYHACSGSPHEPSRSRIMCCAQSRARVTVHQRR